MNNPSAALEKLLCLATSWKTNKEFNEDCKGFPVFILFVFTITLSYLNIKINELTRGQLKKIMPNE
jgi:hypothetical protein